LGKERWINFTTSEAGDGTSQIRDINAADKRRKTKF
jgi:hypothetical protein